jgi:ornithine racemase
VSGMAAPRLEIDLSKIGHNVRSLCALYGSWGASVTAVTKVVLGAPSIARTLVENGVTAIGDSRIENIRLMREAGIKAEYTLIRSPMVSQASLVVEYADISLNTELSVIKSLSSHAIETGKLHKIILMVELGDMREGIMPGELRKIVASTLELNGVELIGVGTNLACFAGVGPSDANMVELSDIVHRIRNEFGIALKLISGGNSASYEWFTRTRKRGLINNVRLGESIFLGRETLGRRGIPGLHTDAFTLIAEVIEARKKPHVPSGEPGQDAFGHVVELEDRGIINKAILGIGKQDVTLDGVVPRIDVDVLGATSDHLILDAKDSKIKTGSEVAFDVDYATLLRSMTSPYITKELS